MTPWPGAFTFHNEKRLKIIKAAPISESVSAAPGTILKAFPDELRVATGKGALSIIEIQGPSGKRLGIADYQELVWTETSWSSLESIFGEQTDSHWVSTKQD